ncbi:N-acetyltransferase family protein [Rhodopila sp.]|uniref:GNAT family N-acetyltransferase n=1 Tax=Rhodopila sp. TaxID=2480087 RepID=UPI003D0F78ED
MTTEDVPSAQRLLSQLGYSIDVGEVRRRYGAVNQSSDHVLVVAEQGGFIIALCHMFARPALDKPPEAVVQALVVDQASRGNGVGKIMMETVESWAADHGFTSIALASHVSRSDAHAFYEAIGYRREATSYLFRKPIE